jgi:hypothetical protein
LNLFAWPDRAGHGVLAMLDLLMLGIVFAFFAAYVGYVHLCDRLQYYSAGL